jgi:hypothetical protein
VTEGEEEGVGGDVHYVVVDQDLERSPKDPRPTLPMKASPRSLTHVLFESMQLCLLCLCIYVSGVEMKH